MNGSLKQIALLLFFLAWALEAQGQGTVEFMNRHTGSPNAPVYESDGVTKLSGSQFVAELLGGPSISTLSLVASTGFLTGAGAGYFIGGTQAVPGVFPGDTGWVQVRVWNKDYAGSFQQAQFLGFPNSWWQSSAFSVVTGGGVQGLPPGALTGLGTSPVHLNSIPEPSVLALVGCVSVVGFLKGLKVSLRSVKVPARRADLRRRLKFVPQCPSFAANKYI